MPAHAVAYESLRARLGAEEKPIPDGCLSYWKAAGILGCSMENVRKFIADGALRDYRSGRFVTEESVVALLRNHGRTVPAGLAARHPVVPPRVRRDEDNVIVRMEADSIDVSSAIGAPVCLSGDVELTFDADWSCVGVSFSASVVLHTSREDVPTEVGEWMIESHRDAVERAVAAALAGDAEEIGREVVR